ncbi:RNA-directed DNA polymerase, eukaryota, reverse transcriptase zinc-binding domain protein, partial [Tanacetum coccineum]
VKFVNTANGKRVTSAVGEQGINVVKSTTCWVWRPKIKVLDHVSKNNGSYICLELKVLVVYHTTNGHQFTMSDKQEKNGYSRANGNCDKHNMVDFLQKPTGSEEFHQIVDFLAGSHIIRRVRNSKAFTYHRDCAKMELINLCFADDLFLFAHGDDSSAKVIMESLDEFNIVSGLTPSLPKSTTYFCNVLNCTKLAILQIMPFEEGLLPIKYLGVPLVPSRFMYKDCKELIEKVVGRINDWKNKFLSIAGRLQLVQSVIVSMHVHWASVFVLPTRVLLDIEQLMRGFLWCQGSMHKGKAKVAWDVVCLLKDEGGLGVKHLDLFKKALMTSHVWKLLLRNDSLWVKWIHMYKIKDRRFWEILCRGNKTWGWRKLLHLRPLIRDFIWYKIGNGQNVSIWYDMWCSPSPLANIISTRDMYRAGLNISSKVSDVFCDGILNWPAKLAAKYPILNSIQAPNVAPNTPDKLEWRSNLGVAAVFAVSTIWQAILTRDVKVMCADMVWFSNCIPRHTFNLWLIMKRRLKTQDSLSSWDLASPHASHISILPIAKRRTSDSVIIKLVIASKTYFLWQEQNMRLFKNNKHLVAQGDGPSSPGGTQHTSTLIETSPQLLNISNTYRKTRTRTRRMGIRIPQFDVPTSVADEAIIKEMHDGLVRATTTASSLEAEQGSGNIAKTQTKATSYGPSSPRTSSECGPGYHFTMRDIPVQARPERVSNLPNEPPLREGNTSQSGEASMQLLELINLYTKLSDKVTSLEDELASTKAIYNKALITLTKRVKKLEKQLKHKRRRAVIDSSENEGPSLDAEDSPKQGRMIEEIEKDETVNLVKSRELGKSHDIAENRMESEHDDDDRTLAETLLNIKKSAAKGKAIIQESEPPKKIKKKEMIQISLDEEFAKSFYEEEQAQILQDEVYAKQVKAQWIADEESIPQEAKQTDERE